MDLGIYISSDNTLMSFNDLISWFMFIKNNNLYNGWSFDEITGGESEFTDKDKYEKAKADFQNLKL